MRAMIFSVCLLFLILTTVGLCLWQTPRKVDPICDAVRSIAGSDLQARDFARLQAQSQGLLRQWKETLPLLSLWIPQKLTDPITEELIRLCAHAAAQDEAGIARSCDLLLHRLELLE